MRINQGYILGVVGVVAVGAALTTDQSMSSFAKDAIAQHFKEIDPATQSAMLMINGEVNERKFQLVANEVFHDGKRKCRFVIVAKRPMKEEFQSIYTGRLCNQ